MNEIPPAAEDTNFAERLPRWQVLLILVGFPALYLANSFMPWSIGLFVRLDHGYWAQFSVSVLVLHWTSVLLAMLFVRQAGGRAVDIGFHWKTAGFLVFAGVVFAVGLTLVGLTGEAPAPGQLQAWQMFIPITRGQKLFWILISITAGFCEEFVYRGFGICVLQGRGWKTWSAVALATLSFVFVHGVAAFFAFPIYAAFGLIFSGIFLWRRRLAPVMYLHALFDVMAVMAM